ncbi:hypothetical protein WJX74_007210 [Apatococcus lobatus]|uniref:AAA+ ATPase domain-containing protein n=1 Tax=Apatococcus lobatus TaxID=904363 RepID=A0AAW1S5J2_9CHLO
MSALLQSTLSSSAVAPRSTRRFAARNAERLRANILNEPRRSRGLPVCANARQQSQQLAAELSKKLPAAGLAALLATLSVSTADVARAAESAPPPQNSTQQAQRDQSMQFPGSNSQAPAVKDNNQGRSGNGLPEGNQWRYSEFVDAVQAGKVERVRFAKDGAQLQLTAVDGRRALVTLPNDPDLVDILAKNGVDISVSEGEQQGNYVNLLGNLLFPLIAFGGLFFLFRRAGGGQGGQGGPGPMGGPMGGAMDFSKNKSKFQEVPETGITFEDVAGVEQAKLELQEVVDFLKNPDKYTQLGAKIPKGCLLVGPPGTGKTLLAKAIAGEAGVPFFSTAASEFVELFVGVGASRVRDLFEKAKAKAPCIIFIDEIDAVGRQRGAGMGGGNDEREQTINQLLSEMDGFEGNTGVIVLAATNRPDVLDSALLRPGRFDRQVTVERPDVAGRIRILKVHSRGKSLGKDVDFDRVSRRTPGFTGADLQNLMNEAAILAARRNLKEISKEEIADALERIVAGPEKKGAVMSEKKKRLVAYHEAGHALIGSLMPEYDSVQKISIVPRGAAGGLTFFAPSEERLESGLYSRSYLENQMAVALGGRVAEELIFGPEEVTTGASGDFQQVARVAKMMVTQMGFSKKLGQLSWSSGGGNPFMGNQMGQAPDCSMTTSDDIDTEVRDMVTRAYRRAKDLVSTNIHILHKLADILMEQENVDGDEFQRIVTESQAEQYLKDDAPEVEIPYTMAIPKTSEDTGAASDQQGASRSRCGESIEPSKGGIFAFKGCGGIWSSRRADKMELHWSMRWEAALAPRNEVLRHTPGQPLDLRAAAYMFELDPAAPLRVWQASGTVISIPTTAQMALEEMCTRTGQAGDDARPFLLQARPKQGANKQPLANPNEEHEAKRRRLGPEQVVSSQYPEGQQRSDEPGFSTTEPAGIAPLLISPDKLQFALEHFAGVSEHQSATLAADLRQKLLQAVSVQQDPMKPRESPEPVPPALAVVERQDQVVSMWMHILCQEEAKHKIHTDTRSMLHACGQFHGQGKTTFGHQIVEGSIGYLRHLKREIQDEEQARARPGELMRLLPRLLCSINLHLNIGALEEPPPATTETGNERLARLMWDSFEKLCQDYNIVVHNEEVFKCPREVIAGIHETLGVDREHLGVQIHMDRAENIARIAAWFPNTDPQVVPEGSKLTAWEKKQRRLNLKGLDGLYGLWLLMSQAADELGVWLLLTGANLLIHLLGRRYRPIMGGPVMLSAGEDQTDGALNMAKEGDSGAADCCLIDKDGCSFCQGNNASSEDQPQCSEQQSGSTSSGELPSTAIEPSALSSNRWQLLVQLLRWVTCGVPLLLRQVMICLVQHVRAAQRPLSSICAARMQQLFIGRNALVMQHLRGGEVQCTSWQLEHGQDAPRQLFVRAALYLPLGTDILTTLSRALPNVFTDVWDGCNRSEVASPTNAASCGAAPLRLMPLVPPHELLYGELPCGIPGAYLGRSMAQAGSKASLGTAIPFLAESHLADVPVVNSKYQDIPGIKPQRKSTIGNSTAKKLQLQEHPWELMLSEAESRHQIEVLESSALGCPHPQSMGPDLFLQAGDGISRCLVIWQIKFCSQGTISMPSIQHEINRTAVQARGWTRFRSYTNVCLVYLVIGQQPEWAESQLGKMLHAPPPGSAPAPASNSKGELSIPNDLHVFIPSTQQICVLLGEKEMQAFSNLTQVQREGRQANMSGIAAQLLSPRDPSQAINA